MRSVTGKGGLTEFKRASYKDGFYNQLEKYLNGVKPRSVNANIYLKCRRTEEAFVVHYLENVVKRAGSDRFAYRAFGP